MSNVTYIRIGNSIVVKTVANRSSDVMHNSTDLVFLFDNAGDAHVKSSISIALTIAACAFLLSCYSCCCFNGFSSWTRSYRIRSRFARSPFTDQTMRWRQHLREQRRQAERGRSRPGDGTGDDATQDRTNSPSQAEVIRRYDLDVESLPSYTLVSGLPSYDDALDQFRKAGIIIQHPSVIKIFEDTQIKAAPENAENADSASVASCSCGGSQTSIAGPPAAIPPVIELSPKQLKMLSQKRLSLQITLNGPAPNIRRNSRSRVDLCREVNRSNLLRSHDIPNIHRSTSSLSTERHFAQRLAYLQHRGSLS